MECIQKEIDKTVWIQFKNAFERIDSELLNSIYADEVLRVTPQGIDTENDFKEKNTERFAFLIEKNATVHLNFWLESRHSNSDTSYEVGYYRITTILDGERALNYGQFHIVLKKIEGFWKIIQDWDTEISNGQVIGKEEFERNGDNKVF